MAYSREPADGAAPARRLHPAVLGTYLLLTLVMTWPLGREFAVAIPGDGFDGWQNYWNLWWVKLALVDRLQSPYYTDLLYYPTGVDLHFHTLNPFNGLAALPVQLAAGLLPAYNAVVLLSWTLAGYGMYLLVGWLLRPQTGRPAVSRSARVVAAFTAGAIFTFAPFHMAHLLGHMQVFSLEWLPFYVLYLLRGLVQSRRGQSWRRSALHAGLFLALAGLCDWYFVLYLVLFTGLAVVWAWGRHRVSSVKPGVWVRRWAAPLGPPLLAGGLFALLLSPLLLPMIQATRQSSYMVRPTSDLYIFSASVMDFLVPNRLHTLFRPASYGWIGNQIAPPSEHTIGLGYAALVLAVVGLWRLRWWALPWALAALFFAALALGPRLHLGNITWEDIPVPLDAHTPTTEWTPYALLNRFVPFMRISRSVSRFALMVQLCVAVLAGLGLAGWLGGKRPRTAVALGGLCLLAVLAESWVAPFPLSPPDTPAYYAQLAAEPGAGAVLNLPMNYDRPGYLLYQTVHQRPLTVAYVSRDDPRTLTERAPLLQHLRHLGTDILDMDPAQVGQTVLADLGVSHVVLDRYQMPGGHERDYTTALAQAVFAGQTPVYEDERLTVYTVTPPAQPAAYLVLGPQHWGPLRTGDDGTRSRRLEGAAEIVLRHAPQGAALRLVYRGAPGAALEVRGPDGQGVLAALPAAATAQTVVLPFADLMAAGKLPVVPETLVLVPSGEVDLLSLGIVLP